MIEDIIAQAHSVVDSLTFEQGAVALAALRAISDSQSRGGPFTHLLGMRFDQFGDGRCAAHLDVTAHLLNPHNIAHGGVTYALADTTSGGAALAALGQPRMVTQDMQIRYHGAARPGRLDAEAEVVHHGRRTITTHCRVTQEGALVATATGTFAILSDAELDNLSPKRTWVKDNPHAG
jgi:acyl-CoA thioesterase